MCLRWAPSHRSWGEAHGQGLVWWHVMANEADDRAATAFALVNQLPEADIAREREDSRRERDMHEGLVAMDTRS